MIQYLVGRLLLTSFVLLSLPMLAAATPEFDALVTQVNGSPVAATHTVYVSNGDVVRVGLFLTVGSGDFVGNGSLGMAFDPTALTMIGPSAGPTIFHQVCSVSGSPCTAAGTPLGASTPDDQLAGSVGSMGVERTTTALPVGSHLLGVVDFLVHGQGFVVPDIPGPQDGTYSINYGGIPVPYTFGPGVSIIGDVIPEPTTSLLVGLGLAGLGLGRNRGQRALPRSVTGSPAIRE